MFKIEVTIPIIQIQQAFVKAKDSAKNEILNGCEQILQDSQMLVPVDTGALQDSGEIIDLGDIIIINYGDEGIGAGGIASKYYAMDQHENLSYAHVNGGQAKYLEEPFVARWNEIYKQAIQAYMDKL